MKVLWNTALIGAASLLIGSMTAVTAFAAISDGSCSPAQNVKPTTTRHTTTIGGKQINYSATVGFLEVTAMDNTSKACIFYTSYAATQAAGSSARPLIFAFNGGPGSASLWLHLGVLGPKRVDMGPDGLTSAGNPFSLIDNEQSPLDVADIVMIDPVATGYSSAEGKSVDSAFFGAKNDYGSVAAFIQNYLNTYHRWNSPKFVMGESYGGVRGSLLAHHLQTDYGIGLAGVILISPMLSTTSLNFGPTVGSTTGEASDQNVAYWTYFPNFATTAWYHKKIAPQYQNLSVDQVYEQARQFANGVLRDALDQGNELSSQDFHNVAKAAADFIGLSQQRIEDLNLKVADVDYFNGLFYDQKLEIGRYDSRFVAQRLPGQNGNNASDPSDNATSFPFTSAINQYLQTDLNFNFGLAYTSMANITDWSYNSDGQEFSVTDDLSQALADNPSLRVFIASGYFDLACPMGTVEYERSQLRGGAAIASRIFQDRFPAGHMMYINPVALVQLKADIAKFVAAQSALPGGPAPTIAIKSPARR